MDINKIYQEDCLDGMKLIDDRSIHMVLCDLPYGTTQNKWDSVINLSALRKQYMRVIKDNGAIVLTCAQPFTTVLISAFMDLFRYDIVWDKVSVVGHLNANRMPLRRHETVCVFYKSLPTYNPQKTFTGKTYKAKFSIKENVGGENYGVAGSIDNRLLNSGYSFPTSIVTIMKPGSSSVIHPTQKPVALFEYLIKTYTNEGEIVLDNCIGSGTTAIACINTGRNYIGFENNEKYFEAAKKRIVAHCL